MIKHFHFDWHALPAAVAHRIPVGPMKTCSMRLAAITFCLAGAALSPLAASAGSATLAYQNRLTNMITPRIIAAVIPRFELFYRAGSGAVGVKFRVRASGEAESVTVTRRHPAGFVNDACVRVISSTKFPSIPAKVIKEQGHPYVDVTTEIKIN